MYITIRPIIISILCSLLAAMTPAVGKEITDAASIVEQAKFDAVEIPKQAEALVRLAWIDNQGNSQAAALARSELGRFGKNSLAALRNALNEVEPRYTADIVALLVASRQRMIVGSPTEFIATLEHAIWVGSVDAKRLAIKEITRYRFRQALLPIIDSAVEHPRLASLVIDTLRKLGDSRARFYLESQVREGSPAIRSQAAAALASIGSDAIESLRELTYSDDAAIRQAAVRAILPHTTPYDLTILHEYPLLYPNDDPELLDLVRERAIQLESLLDPGSETDIDARTSPIE